MTSIVVIDHESMLLDLMSNALRLDGYTVKAMDDPVAACDFIIASWPSVDLLITDTQMQPISGFELVTRLRRTSIDCPVIFTSNHHGLASVIAESFGQRVVIEKPFTAAALRTAVRELLAASQETSSHGA
jgi:two-component system sensor histidine kinase ChiS